MLKNKIKIDPDYLKGFIALLALGWMFFLANLNLDQGNKLTNLNQPANLSENKIASEQTLSANLDSFKKLIKRFFIGQALEKIVSDKKTSKTNNNLTEEEVQLVAQKLIEEGFLPSPNFCAKPRPYTIGGKEIAVDREGIKFLISQDPAYPNGIDENDNPIIPQDLNENQKKVYIDVLYGGTLDWKRIASNPDGPEAKKTLGGCIYCNAPAGAGGCYKKQVLRGLVYNLTKQGWGREEIRQEANVWMKCIFGPDPFLAWGIYYKRIGKNLSEIQATVDKLSRYGRGFVLSQLSGRETKQLFSSQACRT